MSDKRSINITISGIRGSIRIPVNPEELSIEIPSTNETANVVGVGDVTLLRKPGLAKMELKSFEPSSDNQHLISSDGSSNVISFLEDSAKDELPVRVVISGMGFSMEMSIEGVTKTKKAQDSDTHYSVSLREYRRTKVVKLTLVGKSAIIQEIGLSFLEGVKTTTSTSNCSQQTSQVAASRQASYTAVGDRVKLVGNLFPDAISVGAALATASNANNAAGSESNSIPSVATILFIDPIVTDPNRFLLGDNNGNKYGWAQASSLLPVD